MGGLWAWGVGIAKVIDTGHYSRECAPVCSLPLSEQTAENGSQNTSDNVSVNWELWCDVLWCDVLWCDVLWCDVLSCCRSPSSLTR